MGSEPQLSLPTATGTKPAPTADGLSVRNAFGGGAPLVARSRAAMSAITARMVAAQDALVSGCADAVMVIAANSAAASDRRRVMWRAAFCIALPGVADSGDNTGSLAR